MQEYPSIQRAIYPVGKLYTFDKLDGANLRFEYSKQAGFYKYGTRTRLFDATDQVLGGAVSLFRSGLERELLGIADRGHWQRAVVFCEYWGPETLGGINGDTRATRLTPIDAWLPDTGMLEPRLFLKRFGSLGPKFHGVQTWNREFLNEVLAGEFEGAFEGVVGKRVERNSRRGKRGPKAKTRSTWVAYKAKTQAWIDAIRARYGDEADRIIDS